MLNGLRVYLCTTCDVMGKGQHGMFAIRCDGEDTADELIGVVGADNPVTATHPIHLQAYPKEANKAAIAYLFLPRCRFNDSLKGISKGSLQRGCVRPIASYRC